MRTSKQTLIFVICILSISSCTVPTYLSAPDIKYPYVKNTFTLGIQNMDETAKVEEENLICHYENFDIAFSLTENLLITFEIINKSNKSMIIDKSKCYILRNGYATELFKDVRSTRSTTFNNVQDAINNVQTNEAGVSMTVPPYSKLAIAIKETNMKPLEKLPPFEIKEGITQLSQFDDYDITEFVIPYSYDYSLTKWETCRNRVYFNCIVSEKETIPATYITKYPLDGKSFLNDKCTYYISYKSDFTIPIDYTEANNVDDINIGVYKEHRRKVIISHICLSPITFPGIIASNIILLPFTMILTATDADIENTPMAMFHLYGCHDHYPIIYGNKYVQRESGKVKIRKDYKE